MATLNILIALSTLTCGPLNCVPQDEPEAPKDQVYLTCVNPDTGGSYLCTKGDPE